MFCVFIVFTLNLFQINFLKKVVVKIFYLLKALNVY